VTTQAPPLHQRRDNIVSYWLHKKIVLKVAQSPKVLDALTEMLASFLLMKMSGDVFIF
jgi:hypothetical protein